MGRWHADAVRAAGGSIAAVVDRDPEAARSLARRYRGTIEARELDEALRATAVDFVHVCTPLPSHAALARLALEGGAHVLVEKPMATGAPEVRGLLELAESRGRMIVPVHQFAFQRGVLEARERLSGLGQIQRLSFSICSAGGERPGAAPPDRIAEEILPHPISVSLALGLAPEDGSLSVLAPREGELTVLWRTGGGATVSVVVSMAGRPPHNRGWLVGARATLHLDFFHGYGFVERSWRSRWRKALAPFEQAGRHAAAAGTNLLLRGLRREWAYPGLRELVARAYLSARFGGPPPIAPAEALLTAATHEEIVNLADEARKRP